MPAPVICHATAWSKQREKLDIDTLAKGPGSTVARIIDAKRWRDVSLRHYSGINGKPLPPSLDE